MEKLSYTPEEAAAATGLGRTSIFEALRAGRLERRKAGARTIIPAESLKAFLEARPRGRDVGVAPPVRGARGPARQDQF